MADISKIQVPGSATQYNIKDAQARRDIEDVKADLGAQTGVISLIKDYYIKTSDTPIDLTPMSSSVGRMCAVVDCTAGDKFVINAYSDSAQARTWCFIDSANNAISMAEAQADVTDLELTAPNNAAKLIINDISGGMSYKVGNNLANRIAAIEKGGSGLSQDARAALLTCLEHVAWIDEHGQTYYNALEDALYPNRYWDYEWDATSGVAPSNYFGSYGYDFPTYSDAMYADNFYFDFNHVGDVDILFVAKMATEAMATTYRTPHIAVRGAQGSNGYDGFKVVFNTPSGKVETSLSGGFVSTNIDYTNYHEYRVKYENGVGYLYVDGIIVDQGAGVTNNQYIYMTGIFASAMGENGHPDTSASVPYCRMAIKSVKYKRLS